MSDNLAHKLKNADKQEKITRSARLNNPTKKEGVDFEINKSFGQRPSQEMELKRRKYQANQQQNKAQEPDTSTDNFSENNNSENENDQENNYDEVGNEQSYFGTDQGSEYGSRNESKTQQKDKDKDEERKKDKDEGKDKDKKEKKDENKDKTKDKDKEDGKNQNKDENKKEGKDNDDGKKEENKDRDDKKDGSSKDNTTKPDKKPEGLGPKPEKENLRIPAGKSDKTGETNKPKEKDSEGASTAQQLNQAKNIASKALSGDAIGAGEEIAGATTQVGTQWLLTTLWGAVWVDWTLLSLLGLNVFLVFSLLLPNYVCQFGDDYLIGKWIPSKDLAKWTEIIILMIINIFVLSIIVIFIVLIYKMVSCGTWNLFNIWLSGVLPGGDTALSEAEKRCFQ